MAVETHEIDPEKLRLLDLLGIAHHLENQDDITLRFAYQKYIAYYEALDTLAKMCEEHTWPGRRPSDTTVIELFVSKSMWHKYYKPLFGQAHNHADMEKWLQNAENKLSSVVVWGIQKSQYNFVDLDNYFRNGGILVEEKKKIVKKKSHKKEVVSKEIEVVSKGKEVVNKKVVGKKSVLSKTGIAKKK